MSLRTERMHPAVVPNYLRQNRRRMKENRNHKAARRRRIARQPAVEAAENLRIKAAALSEEQRDATRLLIIPSGLSDCSPLARTRIDAYASHLEEVIGKAQSDDAAVDGEDPTLDRRVAVEAMFDTEPELRILSDHVCGICRGGCCVQGDDSAYITPRTVRRFMDANPTLSPADVLAAYLDRLAPETVTNSCINQGPTGCVLPRQQRSDTCNGYYCDELKEWHAAPTAQRCQELLVVKRARTDWRGYPDDPNHVVQVAHVDGSGLVDVPLETLVRDSAQDLQTDTMATS